jgi:hypothetical protein
MHILYSKNYVLKCLKENANWPISEEDQIRKEGVLFIIFTFSPWRENEEESLIVVGLRVDGTYASCCVGDSAHL